MIRVYCQYSISGFKVFQLNKLPHSSENVRYVKMTEVNSAVHGEKQDFVITGTCSCNLDLRILRLFSMNGVSLLFLHNVGKQNDETALYINEPSSKMSYAFVSDDARDKVALLKMASLWLGNKKSEFINRLQKVANMTVQNDEPVFTYHEDSWQELMHDVSNTNIPTSFKNVIGNGKKNILSNLIVDKVSILKQAGIKKPLSSFVTIPGNDEIRKIEQTNRVVRYTVIGVAVLAAIGLTIYCCTNK